MSTNKEWEIMKKWGKGEWIAYLVMLSLMLWVFFKVFFGIISIFEPREDLEHDAYTFCTIFMDTQLKSPATAKYPYNYSDYVEITENRYTVDAYVDAQNSFGGIVRTHFMCVLDREAGESWKLVKFQAGK